MADMTLYTGLVGRPLDGKLRTNGLVHGGNMTKAILLLRGAAFVAGIGLFLAAVFVMPSDARIIGALIGAGLASIAFPNLWKKAGAGGKSHWDVHKPYDLNSDYGNPASPNYIGNTQKFD